MRYTCKHGCGKQSDHKGGMNLHESLHCPVLKGASTKETGAARRGSAAAASKCGCQGGGDWRFLNANDAAHAGALAAGFKKYCTECEEVI